MPGMAVKKRFAGLLALLCVGACLRAQGDEAAPDAGETRPGTALSAGLRVRVELDVAGDLVMPGGGDAASLREPVEMRAVFDFDEWTAAGQDGSAAESAAAKVRRRYREATAAMRVGAAKTTASLAADAREVLVARRGTTPLPYLADGFLSGEEADLLDTPFDSLLLDELLPRGPHAAVAVGDKWQLSGDLTAGLLAIDMVESGGLESRIERVTDGVAEAGLSGVVDGAVDGVPTHVSVEGSFTVSVRDAALEDESPDGAAARHEPDAAVSRVAVVIRERRQASHVAPGFDVEARLLIERTPLDGGQSPGTAHVETEPASPSQRRRGTGGPGQIWYREPQGRFDLVHDSRWRRVENGANGLVLRLVDRGALVGQCSITSLPGAAAAALPDAAGLKRDIERSLAGQVERVEAAEETDRADGLRVVRAVSVGTAERLPFRWIHYLLGARDGSRVSVTFMFEESMRQRFADADLPLIEAIQLSADRTAAAPGAVRQ